MKYKCLLLTILFFISLCATGQNRIIDSLRNELKQYSKRDTTKVRMLNYFIYDLNEYNIYDGIEDLIKESEHLIDSLNFEDGKAELYYFKGHIALKKSEFKTVYEVNQKAYDIYKKLGNKKGMSFSLNSLGIAYYYQGKPSKAIEYYEKSAIIDRERNDLKSVATVMNNIANIYADYGQYDEAMSKYVESKDLRIKVKDSIGIAASYSNIGGLYVEQNDATKALENFNKALDIHNSLEIQNEYATIGVLINLAITYQMQQQYDKTLKYYNKALAICRKVGNKEGIAKCLNGLGFISNVKDHKEEALLQFKEALSINREINNLSGIGQGLSYIADIEYSASNYEVAMYNYEQSLNIANDIGNPMTASRAYFGIAKVKAINQNYIAALESLIKSEDLSIQFNFLDAQRDCKELLYEIYKDKGDYKNALESHVAFKKFNDSIFSKEKIEKIAQLENQYKYQKELDSASIRELKLTKTVKDTTENLEKTQRNLLLGVIAFLALAIILGSVIFFLKLRNAKSRTQNVIIEQKLLRSQMTPHFIFNSLSVLQGMILNKEEDKSISYLSKFSKLLRTVLENSRHKTVLLKDELSAITSYVDLQNLDTDPPFDFTCEIESDLDVASIQIPAMLIQPFIENAIEHAFPDKNVHKEIKMHLFFKSGKLFCTIEDNGRGITLSNHKNGDSKKSLATTITSERLKILSRDFSTTGSLTLKNRNEDGEKGTLVTLVIPYLS